MGRLSNYAANALLNHVFNTAYTPASTVYLALSRAASVRTASYRWTASASGTNEYYLEAAAGGNPGLGGNPGHVIANNTPLAAGTVGSLAAGQWAYADNDTLGFSTIYVRLTDGTDPDSKALDYVLAGKNPLDDASGLSEPAGNAYARTATTFGAAASRRVTQGGAVQFPQATGAWGWITHWAVMSALTGGNLLAYGRLGTPKQIVTSNTFTMLANEVYVEIEAGSVGTVLAHNLLNLMFRNVAYAKPNTYAALTTATVSDTSTGSTISEPSGNNYARLQVNPNGGSSPTWTTATARALSNAALLNFATPNGAWGTIVASAIVSAASAGDVLFYNNDAVLDQAVSANDAVQFAISAWGAGLN